MLSFLRRRRASEKIITAPGLAAVMAGAFGLGTPGDTLSSEVNPAAGLYHFHQADLFTPGTGNWARDPGYETPLQTLWGRGFLCRANAFALLQQPIVAPGALFVRAQGGIIVGGMEIENSPLG